MNRFLGDRRVIEVLLHNQKADALLSAPMKRLVGWFGALSVSVFGYPLTVPSRTRCHDLMAAVSQIAPGSLIDIGCSTGIAHTFQLARMLAPHPVLGVDFDRESITIAGRLRDLLPIDNLTFEEMDVLEGDHLARQFDIVFSSETLEHIDDDRQALRNMVRMARPGGWVVISVPYRDNPAEFNAPKAAFHPVCDAGGLFKGGYHWRSGYNEEKLGALVSSVGLTIRRVIRTRTLLVLPDKPYLFPLAFPLSWLLGRWFGTTSKISVLAQKGDQPARPSREIAHRQFVSSCGAHERG